MVQQNVLLELKENNLDITAYDTMFIGYGAGSTYQAIAEHGETAIRITIGDVTLDGLLPIFPYLTALIAGKKLHSH